MKKLGLALILTGLIFALTGCSGKPDTTIHNVVRIMMHEPYRYTFLVKEGESTAIRALTVWITDRDSERVVILADVPADGKMWVVLKDNNWSGGWGSIEIHIHSEQDINGAGWNHGKGGSGNTEVVK